jgi:hypothetical protein
MYHKVKMLIGAPRFRPAVVQARCGLATERLLASVAVIPYPQTTPHCEGSVAP